MATGKSSFSVGNTSLIQVHFRHVSLVTTGYKNQLEKPFPPFLQANKNISAQNFWSSAKETLVGHGSGVAAIGTTILRWTMWFLCQLPRGVRRMPRTLAEWPWCDTSSCLGSQPWGRAVGEVYERYTNWTYRMKESKNDPLFFFGSVLSKYEPKIYKVTVAGEWF